MPVRFTSFVRVAVAAPVALLMVGGFVASTAAASPIDTVDQQQLVSTIVGSKGGGNSIGQSFTPTLNRIDAAEVSLAAAGPVSFQLLVLDGVSGAGGLSSPVIGMSDPVPVNSATLSMVHFDLQSPLALTPGQVYVLHVVNLSGTAFNFGATGGNPYPGGQSFQSNLPTTLIANEELVFSEGLHVPEPTSLGLCAAAVGAGALRRRQ